ncbi:hypothetical protein COZ40_01520 [Candidatus Roizmanbacteria bacterium CG_4_10_14_3_um_filter_39_13]|uniref:HTH cro/C1-type domain-containing protein n=4 Tax=Candidatus Roizmaniibacteriota TaxID=1752723 RepID=A0A2H0KJF1_9BACT|nr:MAG: hypothetical protein COV87_03775 [Candidatus Roizmanbacteria bacterium CG11_big_fil_rev_8_21_14_0_20_37_16]PIV08436.1 MAG: hypothetical protein COS52_02720 [Candidatus Roizmanbacteria bacterium CG03_land_8_20_14_0_80_39_12]PIV70893.1 MAG: hypothetical protein COW57_02705 [Candidatus Roizmanbacteria bacterium CG17_big_fil_post_rev_8_21_14_2_50_39_7]PIX68772.1 MAG: hypothetical protein COZ40_01520 [Candidatus Roizmanbacteria bacterium CG_4_10_14_3_um_filter_39_13]
MFYWRTRRRLGFVLRRKRLELNISQEYVSLEISIDRMGLSQLENGKTNPTLFLLLKVSHILDTKLWKILKEINV